LDLRFRQQDLLGLVVTREDPATRQPDTYPTPRSLKPVVTDVTGEV